MAKLALLPALGWRWACSLCVELPPPELLLPLPPLSLAAPLRAPARNLRVLAWLIQVCCSR